MRLAESCKPMSVVQSSINTFFDGLIAANIFSGWIRDQGVPERLFKVELWHQGTLAATGLTDKRLDADTASGRYCLEIPTALLDGSIRRFEIRCPELQKVLATPCILAQSAPTLADSPFLANQDCENLASARYWRNKPSLRAGYLWHKEKLQKQLNCREKATAAVSDCALYIRLAKLEWKHGRLDLAQAAWERAILAAPQNAAAHAGYLGFLYWTGREQDAACHYNNMEASLRHAHCVRRAYEKILALLAAPAFHASQLRKDAARHRANLSVVVPNYNYARFLSQRLESVLAQEIWPAEIIIIDDASTDSSMRIIEAFERHSPIPTRVYANQANSGNIFSQWIKGIELAQNELIWIAEADDFCDAQFLGALLPAFQDRQTVLAWTDSTPVNDYGIGLTKPYKHYYNGLTGKHPDYGRDFLLPGAEMMRQGLMRYCTLPNASAVIFRKNALPEDLQRIQEFRNCGDWWLWRRLALKGRLKYVAAPLNCHRKRRWGSLQGRASGELLEQHLRIHQDLLAANQALHDPAACIAVTRSLQREYRAFCYEAGNEQPYWLVNNPRFASQFQNLLEQMPALQEECRYPSLKLLMENEVESQKWDIIANSPFFDAEYYLEHNPDVKASGMDPALHYLRNGWKEGRIPCAIKSELEAEIFKSGKTENPLLFIENLHI